MLKKLSVRIMIPTVTAVVLAIAVFGWALDVMLEREVRARAQQEVDWHTRSVLQSMQTLDGLTGEYVRTSMRILLFEGGRIGRPSGGGTAPLNGQNVPDLRFGEISQVGNFTLVDQVQRLTGATVSLLSHRGTTFFPVSTNVLGPDGKRALASFEVDLSNEGMATLVQGKPDYRVDEVVEQPYVTGSEPILDASGTIIGSWYVGFPMRGLTELGKQIREMTILDHGMIAVVRSNGKVLFKSEGTSDQDVIAHFRGTDTAQWTTTTRKYEPWGYTVVAAYPELDVIRRRTVFGAWLSDALWALA